MILLLCIVAWIGQNQFSSDTLNPFKKLFGHGTHQSGKENRSDSMSDTAKKNIVSVHTDTVNRSDSILPASGKSTAVKSSLKSAEDTGKISAAKVADSILAQAIKDSAKVDSLRADSVAAVAAALAAAAQSPCASDTMMPWVTPDPAGGLHYGAVSVVLSANKICRVEYRLSHGAWADYSGKAVAITKSDTLFFRATDSCGKKMDERFDAYTIKADQSVKRCPGDMIFVDAGSGVCIDRFEWPNRKGVKPFSNVSFYQANDSCFLSGKRLCTTKEWSDACSGPAKSRYPYGTKYEPRICVTHDTARLKSGAMPECRSWYGAFDMSGNLSEWTSTHSEGNGDFYNVMGGFWQSAGQADCFDERSSYFPQNRHNPVGFRCCKDPTAQ